jgi:hypothetical protein
LVALNAAQQRTPGLVARVVYAVKCVRPHRAAFAGAANTPSDLRTCKIPPMISARFRCAFCKTVHPAFISLNGD